MASVLPRIYLTLSLGIAAAACTKIAPEEQLGTLSQSQGIVNGDDETGFEAVGALIIHVPGREPTGSSCSGTLIDPEWVLTAAHCIEGIKNRAPRNAPPSDTYYLNFYIGNNANDKESGRRIPASQIFVHPGYYTPGGDRPNDIALFQLSEPVLDVPTIPLHRARLDDQLGARLFYVGFGVNEPDGGGGGHKRSIALTLYDVAPNIYVTRQQGGGVCFGDSGGPGLLEVAGQHEVIGVNSTVFGEQKCRAYSTQMRVDSQQTWIDYIMNNGRGCLDSPGLCHCDGVCSDNGVCDNAQCGESQCKQITECLGFCNSYPCAVLCYLRASPIAYYLYAQIAACAREKCPDGGSDCIDEHCHREQLGCEDGIDAVTGESNCGQLHRCSTQCDRDDRDCLDLCYFDSSLDAQGAFEDVEACVQERCTEGETPNEISNCTAESCRSSLLGCMPDEKCRLTGGNCPEDKACAPEAWIASYCVPTQQIAIGEACDPSQVSCVDGAFCIDDGNGPVCREVCSFSSDCDVGFPPCRALHQGNLAFSIGLCQLKCIDQDGDGSCDEDDCDPNNPYIHPEAVEICDLTQVDENCDGIINDTCPVPPEMPAMVATPEPKKEKGFWSCECLLSSSLTGVELSFFLLFGLIFVRRPRLRSLSAAQFVGLSLIVGFAAGCNEMVTELPMPPAAVAFDGGFMESPGFSHDAGASVAPGIWEIQQGLVEPGVEVILKDIYVSSPAATDGFFISDGTGRPFSGVFVARQNPDESIIDLSVGDVIQIKGIVNERAWDNSDVTDGTQTRTEILLAQAADLTRTATAAEPPSINISRQELGFRDSAEMYEGVLVHLQDMVVTATQAHKAELVLNEVIPLDNMFMTYDLSWLNPGIRIDDLTGLVHYEDGEFKIAPRFPRDLSQSGIDFGGCIPVDNYVVCKERKSWLNSQADCASLGGRLVLLKNTEKNEAVSNMVKDWSDRSFWIGLSDRWTEDRWRWTDGSTLTFDAWSDGEPNDWGGGEDCAESNFRNTGEWNDGKCNGRKVYVCEFPNQGPKCTVDEDCAAGPGTCVDGSCVPE